MKPNMIDAHPKHLEVTPTLAAVWYKPAAADTVTGDFVHGRSRSPLTASAQACEFAVESVMPTDVHTEYGAPETVWLRLSVNLPEKLAAHSKGCRLPLARGSPCL